MENHSAEGIKMKLYLPSGEDLGYGRSHTNVWSRSLLFLSQNNITVMCTEDSPHGNNAGFWSDSFLKEYATKLKEVREL